MAVTSLTATAVGPFAWRLDWASDVADAAFRVYRNGVLVDTTTAGSAVVGVPAGEAPAFEVLDDDPADPEASAAPTPAYPDRVTLAWYAAAGAAAYRVDELVGGDWVERARVPDDGTGYQDWTSGPLADGTAAAFRVVPVGANGNDGTPAAFTALVVRFPDPPAVAYAYAAGTGVLTITATP